MFPLTQHAHTVGNTHYFVEFVRNDDDTFAVGFHCAQYVEQPVRFRRGKHGGRFVEDKYVCAAVKCFDNLHRLLFRHRHVVDFFVGIYLKTVFGTHLHNTFFCKFKVVLFLNSKYNVFRSGKYVHQFEVLVNHSYAACECVLGGSNDYFLSAYAYTAAVGEVNTDKHVHKRGLAAAVFAEYGENFPFANVHRNVLIGDDGTECFGNIRDLYCYFVAHSRFSVDGYPVKINICMVVSDGEWKP